MINKIVNIAKEAGEIIKEGFYKVNNIEYKTNLSNLVTEVDKASERKIIDFLKLEYPNHNILAEESGEISGNSDYTWVIDPLDGTTNFVHRLPIFSVSIGLVKNNQIVLGVVYDVMRDLIYCAEIGSGAFANDSKIEVSNNADLRKSVLVTGFPYDIYENPSKAIEKFNAFLVRSRAIRRLGSAAIDLCYVASGVFDGFWEVNLQPWDIAAGKLIVEEAKGYVSNFVGEQINIYSNQILAKNKNVHNDMLKILNESN